MSDLQPHEPWPARLLCPWDPPGESTGGGAMPFSRGAPQPRDQTQVPALQAGALWTERHGMPHGDI